MHDPALADSGGLAQDVQWNTELHRFFCVQLPEVEVDEEVLVGVLLNLLEHHFAVPFLLVRVGVEDTQWHQFVGAGQFFQGVSGGFLVHLQVQHPAQAIEGSRDFLETTEPLIVGLAGYLAETGLKCWCGHGQ